MAFTTQTTGITSELEGEIMPAFLEKKLEAEYGKGNPRVYATMNKIGAMHGNKITEKGREMERKHAAHTHRSVYVSRHKEKHGNS